MTSRLGVRPTVWVPFALALAGCIETGLSPGEKDRDRAETGEATPAGACDPAEDNRPVEVRSTCTLPPADWSLRVRWEVSVDDAPMAVSTGRAGDTDGDGVTDNGDEVGVWLTRIGAADEGPAGVGLNARGEKLWEDDDLGSAWRLASTPGPASGGVTSTALFIQSWYEGGASRATAIARGDTLYDLGLGSYEFSAISLVDLDNDGSPEVLSGGLTWSAATGDAGAALPGAAFIPVAADLDLDGTSEVVTVDEGLPVLLHPDGGRKGSCPVDIQADDSPGSNTRFAVAELDGDAEGEFVVANAGVVAICGADGSLLAEAEVPVTSSDGVGIAELDGDELPEILLAQTLPDASAAVVLALDTDLSPIWTRNVAEGGSHLPFSVADLDGDGRHEVIIRRDTGVVLLSPDGAVLAEIDTDRSNASSTFTPPILTDIDGDGRAEILVGGKNPNLAVVENAAGGWPVRGAEDWWPGMDHFPGDRAMDGSVPPGSAQHWLGDGTNVWQGLAAGPPALPDLGVDAVACSEDCVTTVVVARVANYGLADAPGPVQVDLLRADGTVVASTTLASVASGTRVPVSLTILTAETADELRVRVTGRGVECLDVANEAVVEVQGCEGGAP